FTESIFVHIGWSWWIDRARINWELKAAAD
ncbi:MAG: hypothetical protein ACI89J_004095, partial [Hyphomicrobiaceae bacterium]